MFINDINIGQTLDISTFSKLFLDETIDLLVDLTNLNFSPFILRTNKPALQNNNLLSI